MSEYFWKGPFLMKASDVPGDRPDYIGHYEWDKNIQEYKIIVYAEDKPGQPYIGRWEHFVTLPADDPDTISEAARVLIITAYEERTKC